MYLKNHKNNFKNGLHVSICTWTKKEWWRFCCSSNILQMVTDYRGSTFSGPSCLPHPCRWNNSHSSAHDNNMTDVPTRKSFLFPCDLKRQRQNKFISPRSQCSRKVTPSRAIPSPHTLASSEVGILQLGTETTVFPRKSLGIDPVIPLCRWRDLQAI